jgi:hypothetical protein
MFMAMKHAFYQQLYEAEFQRRDHLQSAVGTPFSVLVLVGTGLVLLAQKFRTADTLLQTLFWVSYATAVVAFAVTVYMLIRSFHGYVYERIPFPSQILDYHEGLKAHHTAAGKPGLAEEEFDVYLRRQYIEAADRNSVLNVNRAAYLNQGNRALILCLCALAGCAVPHLVAVRKAKPEPQLFQLVNGSRRDMPDREKPPVAPVVVPPKPVPPANIEIRTGTRLPSTSPAFDRAKR